MMVQRAAVLAMLFVCGAAHAGAPDEATLALRQATKLEAKGRLGDAIDAYAEVALRYPDLEPAGRALVARASLLETVSDIEGAANAYLAAHVWVYTHPDTTSAELVARGAGSLRIAGHLFAVGGALRQAADAFDLYVQRYGERADAMKVGLAAGEQRELSGDLVGAAVVYERLIQTHGRDTPTRMIVAYANAARAAHAAGWPADVVLRFLAGVEQGRYRRFNPGGTSEIDDLIWTDDPDEFDPTPYLRMARVVAAALAEDQFTKARGQATFDVARVALERAGALGQRPESRVLALRLAELHLRWATKRRAGSRVAALEILSRLAAPRADALNMDAVGRRAAQLLHVLEPERHTPLGSELVVPAPLTPPSFIRRVRRGAVVVDFR